MRRFKRYWPTAAAAVLLLICAAIYIATDSDPQGRQPRAGAMLADQRVLETARLLAASPETSAELLLAREALRLADRELDQAFATALREAEEFKPGATGKLKPLADAVNAAKSKVAKDQDLVQKLTKAANPDSAGELELAKAHLSLDREELNGALEDLAREGGDERAKLQHALQEHEATHATQLAQKTADRPRASSLLEQIEAWFAAGARASALERAAQQATTRSAVLLVQHNRLEGSAANKTVPAEDDEETGVIVARLRRLSDQRRTVTELDKRMQDLDRLASVYQRWQALAAERRKEILHAMLGSLAWIFAIALAVSLAYRAIRDTLRQAGDRRRLHQARVIATTALSFIAIVAVLVVIFGAPSQTPAIIGLTTAGLTVVLKDFIVSFFGWFALAGKNGINVGDWVEIRGVGGEVIEIGLLRTVLLEIGTQSNSGHPTGRRVAFRNSFAIEGHYFNFSTTSQWLWDELTITLPIGSDPYRGADHIRQLVQTVTADDAREAEEEWARVTQQYGSQPFSAIPTADMRPSINGGLDLTVRYITRAPRRHIVKTRLLEGIVDFLHKPAVAPRKLES